MSCKGPPVLIHFQNRTSFWQIAVVFFFAEKSNCNLQSWQKESIDSFLCLIAWTYGLHFSPYKPVKFATTCYGWNCHPIKHKTSFCWEYCFWKSPDQKRSPRNLSLICPASLTAWFSYRLYNLHVWEDLKRRYGSYVQDPELAQTSSWCSLTISRLQD